VTDALFSTLQSRLGPAYRLERELTGGGMSRVFLAHEVALKRDVVVKVLPPDLLTASSLARFRREIEVTAQLQHPHILPVLSAGGDERLSWYITPYVRGESLRDRLAEGPLPEDQALRIGSELLGALRSAHVRGIVHRDIKPGNVLLSEGHAILADFGIARALTDPEGGVAGPSGSSVAGTEAYRAPERPQDAQADLYGTAVLLREMLGPAPANGRRGPIDAVVDRATGGDPATRFRDADAFLGALREAARTPRRDRRWSTVAALAAIGLVVLLWRGEAPPQANGAPVPQGPSQLASAPAPADSTATIPLPDPVTALADSVERLFRQGRAGVATPVLRRLLAERPDDALGWLRLAEVLTWSSDPAAKEEARGSAVRAANLKAGLSPADAALADGLRALNEARFSDACAAFRTAGRIRADFASWFGQGECRRRNDRVRVENGIATFEGDYAAAASAYEEAWRLPGAVDAALMVRILEVLPTSAGRMRRGVTTDGTVWFGLPVARGDSITYDLQLTGPRRMTPELSLANTRARAIARARVRPLILAWIRRAPDEPDAHAKLAELLEEEGQLRQVGPDGVTALGENAGALLLATDPASRFDLTRDRLRMLLRAGEWEVAGRLGDSLVRAFPTPTNVQAEGLVGPAAVLGKLGTAVALAQQQGAMPQRTVRLQDGTALPMPPAIADSRIRFGIRAASGICDEELRGAPARLMAALDVASPPGGRPRGLEAAYLERTLMLALDCLGPEWIALIPQPLTPPVQVARALELGDTARARGILAGLDAARQRGLPAVPTADQVVAEAIVRLQSGDSAGARRVLLHGIESLPLAPNQFLHNEVPAAALPRMLALAAELEAVTGDRATARRWARGALALWRTADPELGPAVARLHPIAAEE